MSTFRIALRHMLVCGSCALWDLSCASVGIVMVATADNSCHGGGATSIESIHVGNLLMKIQLSEVIIT
jgi:hypothetical protein